MVSPRFDARMGTRSVSTPSAPSWVFSVAILPPPRRPSIPGMEPVGSIAWGRQEESQSAVTCVSPSRLPCSDDSNYFLKPCLDFSVLTYTSTLRCLWICNEETKTRNTCSYEPRNRNTLGCEQALRLHRSWNRSCRPCTPTYLPPIHRPPIHLPVPSSPPLPPPVPILIENAPFYRQPPPPPPPGNHPYTTVH